MANVVETGRALATDRDNVSVKVPASASMNAIRQIARTRTARKSKGATAARRATPSGRSFIMLRVAITAWAALMLTAADQSKAPIAENPIVSISGRIVRVDAFRPGEGMPAIVVDVDGTATPVMLGSMRYLMERNFNPKAGSMVQVKGYKLPASIIAIEVRLPAENLTVKLRDENGWPLWRGGVCPRCGRSSK
jgi:hypothetical protein